jgi:predicted permease
MWRDIRFANLTLVARPAIVLLAALSLALGIGANSAIFSVIDGLWFRPPGVEQPSKLVRIFSVTPDDHEGFFSYPEYLDLRAEVPAFREVVAIGGRGAILVESNGHQLLNLNLVSANFFTALGVHAAVGRLFNPEDSASAAQSVSVVLGNAFWKRHYGGDPAIVGKQIRIQRARDLLVTVVGILPQNFRSLDSGGDRDLWFCDTAWPQLGDAEELHTRGNRWFNVLGVLAPQASLREADTQIHTAAQRMASAYPQTNTGRSAVAISDLGYRMKSAGANGLALLAIVLLVIVISSVNVANLLLSRGASRSTEMAIRLSMGADRSRLVRQLMTENFLLGTLGILLGLGMGAGIIRVLPSIIVAPPGFLSAIEFKLDDRVLLFTLAISVATIFFFGLAPALRSSRTALIPALKGEITPMSGSRRWPARNWLVLTQVAMSLTLLACSAVVVKSFANTRTEDLGFARKQLLLVWLSADAKPELYHAVISRFQQLPGIRSVAAAVRAPLSLSSNGMAQLVRLPGQAASTPPYEIKYNSVTANFFSTMGTPVLRGRGFDSSDETGASNSVLINEQMAQRFWPNEDPVGKTFLTGSDHPKLRQVIGVVKNAPINEIGEAPESYLYLPYWSNFEQEVTFFLETDEDAGTMMETARKALKSVNASLDPLTMVTENDLIRYSAQRYQLTAALVTALGAIGLLLTVVGVYGVVSYGVSLRTRELGIRMALGADRAATLYQVLREVGLLGLVGTVIGLPAALLATHAMRALLFGVGPWSATAFVSAVAILASSLLLAGLVPALRATRIEPSHALRTM